MKNLVTHILRKDLRHLWPWLALWWLAIALAYAQPAWTLSILTHPPFPDPFRAMGLYILGLFIRFVLALTLLGFLVTADSPTDDRAFWRTQPLSGLHLLAAKLLFLLVFCIGGALLIQAVSLVLYDFSGAFIWKNLQNTAEVFLSSLAIALLAAVLFRRPYIGFAVVIGLFVALTIIASTAGDWLLPDHRLPKAGQSAVEFVYWVTFAAALGGIYLTQRRRLALCALGVGFILVSLIGLLWPAANPSQPPSELAGAPRVAIQVSLSPGVEQLGGYTGIRATVSPDSVTPKSGEVWIPFLTNSTVVWPSGSSFTSASNEFQSGGTESDLGFAQALSAWGVAHFCSSSTSSAPLIVKVNGPEMGALRKNPAILHGQIGFRVGHLEEIFRLPLNIGALCRYGPAACAVIPSTENSDDVVNTSVTSVDGHIMVTQVDDPAQSSTVAHINPSAPVIYGPSEAWHIQSNGSAHQISIRLVQRLLSDSSIGTAPYSFSVDYYLLINARRHEALVGRAFNPDESFLGDFRFNRANIDFLWLESAATPSPSSTADLQAWLAGAQFVQLRFVPDRTVAGSFTLDPFIAPKN
jgi:hypothetical protein